MDTTVSVSKGCFVYKPQNYNKSKQKKSIIDKQLWCEAYKKLWFSVESELEALHEEIFSEVLENLVTYVKDCHINRKFNALGNEIPCATLLTGVNLPDHDALFSTLSKQLYNKVTPFVATLQTRHCTTIRSTVEHMVMQFLNPEQEDSDDEMDAVAGKLKKSQCNFITLSAWYKEQSNLKSPKKSPKKRLKENVETKALVIIIPNLESFSPTVLQQFIQISSVHISTLPLVFVFGVATAVSTLHRILPHHVSSKLCNRVFQSQVSTIYLNHVIEKVFLTASCPFHLDDKTFKLLIDVFLFYNFSVHGFIQSFKYCMMEHFYNTPYMVLCCPLADLSSNIKSLKENSLEELKQLPSFCTYLNKLSRKEKEAIEDYEYFKIMLKKLIKEFHIYLRNFHTVLKCLHALTSSLPKAPLGKQLREVYSMAVSSKIFQTSEYKECFQLLGFQSRDELLEKLEKCLTILDANDMSVKHSKLESLQSELHKYCKEFENINSNTKDPLLKSPTKVDIGGSKNRYQFKEKLLELSRQQKPMTAYEETRKNLLEYLSESAFPEFLVPPVTLPFSEVFFFNKVATVKRLIIGTPRAALHMALNNPHYYLQCKCCKSNTSNPSQILQSLPDVCIVYKLHLECGRLINLYDWLQAFLSIVSPNDSGEEQREVPPKLQARFTRAVAELQFLGFIKPSRKKTDHVMRLTWGAS